jgi:hypothetical protein
MLSMPNKRRELKQEYGIVAIRQWFRDLIRGSPEELPIERVPRELPVSVPTVQFLVPINGVWGTLVEQSATASLLLDHYLDAAINPEEVFAAAVWVHADGTPWNSPEYSELFDHVAWWLEAVKRLLEGETSAFIWAWEDSSMHATRVGERIILEERTHHVRAQLPPVCFELESFAWELLNATREGASLELQLMQLAEERYPVEWERIVLDHERRQAGLPPIPSDTPPDPIMDEVGRRLLNATGRELIRLGKEIDREERKRRQSNPEGFLRRQAANHLQNILGTLHGGELSSAWRQLSMTLEPH